MRNASVCEHGMRSLHYLTVTTDAGNAVADDNDNNDDGDGKISTSISIYTPTQCNTLIAKMTNASIGLVAIHKTIDSTRPFLCILHPSIQSFIYSHTTNETLHNIDPLVACRPACLPRLVCVSYMLCCMHLFATCIATQCDTMTDDHLHTIRLNALNDCGILCFCDCRLLSWLLFSTLFFLVFASIVDWYFDTMNEWMNE